MMTKEERNIYMQSYRRKRKENAVCIYCGACAVPGKVLCEYCRERHNLLRKIKRDEQRKVS